MAPPALMTAVTYVITALETGRRLGHALVCVEARYASVRWSGDTRLDRRFGAPATWRSVAAEQAPGFDAGPLSADSGVVQLLIDDGRRRSVAVQYVSAVPITAAPEDVVGQLDRQLRQLPAALTQEQAMTMDDTRHE